MSYLKRGSKATALTLFLPSVSSKSKYRQVLFLLCFTGDSVFTTPWTRAFLHGRRFDTSVSSQFSNDVRFIGLAMTIMQCKRKWTTDGQLQVGETLNQRWQRPSCLPLLYLFEETALSFPFRAADSVSFRKMLRNRQRRTEYCIIFRLNIETPWSSIFVLGSVQQLYVWNRTVYVWT